MCIVHSSYGDITISSEGKPIEFIFFEGCSEKDLPTILWFDVEEYKQFFGHGVYMGSIDILDIGFWYYNHDLKSVKYAEAEFEYRTKKRR